MEVKNYFAQDSQGNAQPNATCYLYAIGTEDLVTGLTNINGQPIDNPFHSDSFGLIQFKAPNGLYDLRVVSGVRDYRIRVQSNDLSDSIGLATDQANRADSAANSASISALSAKAAADAAQLSTGIYDTTALGLANTTSGQYFSVPSAKSSEYLILYKNNAGVPTLIKTYPSTQGVIDTIAEKFTDVNTRAGYIWGVLDAAQRLGIGLTTDGKFNIGSFKDVVGHITDLELNGPEERSTRSGYLWGVLDAVDRLALGLDVDGNLYNKGRNILDEIDATNTSLEEALSSILPLQRDARSGYLWGVMDAVDRLALALDTDGNLINKGRNILKELDSMGDSKWITPSKNIATWGDSLSENAWQPFLRLLMPDRNIHNGGIGGQKSGQIARRQGGIAPMISITGNTIPASGGVVVSVDVPFLNNSTTLFGHLYGVFGSLTAVDQVHMFTRAFAGDPVQIDAITPFIISKTDYDYDFRTTIIWAGNNDYQSIYRPEVDGNVSKMVDFLKSQDKRFIVIGMAIAAYSDRLIGTPYYTDTMALHKKWREKWPNNFIDITPVLQRHYDPNNPTDVQNLLDGCTPSSLRVDEIHLNDAGKQIVADTIYKFMIQRGW